MDHERYFRQAVKFKPSVVVNGVEIEAGVHVRPYLGRVFRIAKLTTSRNKLVAKLEGDDAPTAWVDIGMLDFVDLPEEDDSFTDEDRAYYDRAFKSLFLNA